MARPKTDVHKIIRGFSLHPTIVAYVHEDARRQRLSASRVVEDALARHYGLGTAYLHRPPVQPIPMRTVTVTADPAPVDLPTV